MPGLNAVDSEVATFNQWPAGLEHRTGYTAKMKIDGWIFSQVANLLTQLDATMEGGKTALDNSVVMTMNDMDEGANHYVGKIPFLLVGSCGGYFKSGGLVQRYTKTPHNKLLATLCNAMDVPVTGYGDPKYAGNIDTALTT